MRFVVFAGLCALNVGCFTTSVCTPMTGVAISGAVATDIVGTWEDNATLLGSVRHLEFRSDGTVVQTDPPNNYGSSQFSSRTGTWQAVAAPTERVKTVTGTQTLDELVNDPKASSAGPLSAGVLTVAWSDGSVQRGAVYTSATKLGSASNDTHLTDNVPVYGGYQRVECEGGVAR